MAKRGSCFPTFSQAIEKMKDFDILPVFESRVIHMLAKSTAL